MTLHYLQAFFLGVCIAVLALIVQVFISLIFSLGSFHVEFSKASLTALQLLGVVSIGALIEEVIRVCIFSAYRIRRSITQNLPTLGLLMGSGFAACEVLLRISFASHLSEYLGLLGIFILHSLLGLILGTLLSRQSGHRFLPLQIFWMILALFIIHVLYNAFIIFFISPIVNT